MDYESVSDAVDFLEMKIKTQQLHLTDLNGRLLMTTMNDNSFNFSHVILIVLCITLVMIVVLIFILVYISRRLSRVSKASSAPRNQAYRNVNFGRDSSQSIGKYSYDSGLWLGPGPEPAFTVPDAPYYRPPTVEQIARTPRPVTAVRTRLKRNWDVDERALSTIPDDHPRQNSEERNYRH
nr:uncharacterized protein LOC107455913 [Parasteatoda tepidariorum]